MELFCFRKALQELKRLKYWVTFTWTRSAQDTEPAWKPIQWCVTWASWHLKGCKIMCANLFFFKVLAAINGILNHISQSLECPSYWDYNEPATPGTKSYLWECVCCTWPVVLWCVSLVILPQYDTFPSASPFFCLFCSADNYWIYLTEDYVILYFEMFSWVHGHHILRTTHIHLPHWRKTMEMPNNHITYWR